jgi:hypothetical protein
MKYADTRPYADPEKAARRLLSRNGSSWRRQSMTGDGRAAIRNSGSYPDSSRRGHAQLAREIDHVA